MPVKMTKMPTKKPVKCLQQKQCNFVNMKPYINNPSCDALPKEAKVSSTATDAFTIKFCKCKYYLRLAKLLTS